MPTFSFVVPGVPKSERKRNVRRGEHAARVDTPDRVDWKGHIRACIHYAMADYDVLPWGNAPIRGPVTLTIHYFKPKPASYPKNPTQKYPWPEEWMTKPDCTNMTKIIEDCMNKIVWGDDAQVVTQHIHKGFDELPRAEVTVEWREEESRESPGKSASTEQLML